MDKLLFYGELGFFHVLDPGGYDHVLFLAALALPFGFGQWKRVFWLATLFTIAHCFSLALAALGVVEVNAPIVEFLIPVTILLTALFNLLLMLPGTPQGSAFRVHLMSTAVFGLIHGLGFSNYFGMLMSGEVEKTGPLAGFALGIEVAQLSVLAVVMGLSHLLVQRAGLSRPWYVLVVSCFIIGVSGYLIYGSWPL